MAAKKKSSKTGKNHPLRSELKKHGRKHERGEGAAFERAERKREGYGKKREKY